MKDGDPWFVAKDVAEVLGYKRPAYAIAAHCKSPKLLKHGESPTLGIPPRGINIIPERDLYRLVINSKLPQAESFEEWEVATVLPAINGSLITS